MKETKVIGIIGAMESETAEIKKAINIEKTVKIAGMEFVKGRLGKNTVVLSQCGVGKVFAAVCTQAMIMEFSPDLILNVGVCGAIDDGLKLCDMIIGEKVLQYDMDTTAVGDPPGLISGINKIYFDCDKNFSDACEDILKRKNINYKKGIVATGDKFLNDSLLTDKIRTEFGAISGDMESGAIGHVCYINDVPFGILRCILDSGDEDSADVYTKTLNYAAHIVFEVVCELSNDEL